MAGRVVLDNRKTPCAVGLIKAARLMAELEPGTLLEIWSRDRFAPWEIRIWAEADGHRVDALGWHGTWPARHMVFEVTKDGAPTLSREGIARPNLTPCRRPRSPCSGRQHSVGASPRHQCDRALRDPDLHLWETHTSSPCGDIWQISKGESWAHRAHRRDGSRMRHRSCRKASAEWLTWSHVTTRPSVLCPAA